MVASGLGIAALPKAAALPILRAMNLGWRPLADDWARRTMLVGVAAGSDAAIAALRDFLCEPPSQKAKAPLAKRR
jgi:DNA-binding transcriptional LysR family regulator